jgi:transcriptional regulator with XRE-family HTH domain
MNPVLDIISDIFCTVTGQVLRDARRRHGVSQASLAARAGTSQAAVSRIERGVVSPTVDTLGRLFDVLGEALVLTAEPIDYGHDRTLLRRNLALSPEERLRRGVEWSNAVKTFPRVRN